MSENQKSMTQKLQESAPNARQTVRFMTAATVGTILFILSGITLTATVLALIVATPLLVLFSPVLVPAGMALVLMIGGFVTSGGFGVAALSALTWLYNYVAGKQPVGADQLDHAKNTLGGKAKEYAKGIAVDKLIEMVTPGGMITIPVVKWIYKYLEENYPDEVDSVKEALGSKIEECGQYLQEKAHKKMFRVPVLKLAKAPSRLSVWV